MNVSSEIKKFKHKKKSDKQKIFREIKPKNESGYHSKGKKNIGNISISGLDQLGQQLRERSEKIRKEKLKKGKNDMKGPRKKNRIRLEEFKKASKAVINQNVYKN